MKITDIMTTTPPGERGLLAYEIAHRQGKLHGPPDGRCELCGKAASEFLLALMPVRWACFDCNK